MSKEEWREIVVKFMWGSEIQIIIIDADLINITKISVSPE